VRSVLERLLQIVLITLISGFAFAGDPVMVWVGFSDETLKHQQAVAVDDAKKDIANGELIIKGFGLPPLPEEKDFRAKILAKYHIREGSLGCIVDDLSQVYVNAYNAVVNVEIARRYGKDFWKKVDAEVEKSSKEQTPSAQGVSKK